MNEQALQDAYNLFVQTGYNGDINKFMNLMSTNPEALQDAHNLFVQTGYNGDINKFKTLIGVGQQQPTVQPIQQQPTVKKKDDMEWDWFGGDGSLELEPSKTERPTTVAEASQTWKKAEAPKPMFVPDYTKPIEEEKFTLTRPTELGFVGRATPEQLKEQVPEFLKTSINAVTNDLLNKGADSAKKELDYYFKDAGFDFMPVKRQGFEDIIVRSPNGQELMVSLGAYNIGNATKEIKQFIEENSNYIPNLKKVEKQYLEDSKKILNIKQVDDEMKSLNEKAESLRKDMNLYLEDSAKLKQLEDKLISYPEKLKNTQEYKTLVEEYSAMAEDNKATYDFLEQSRQAIVSYENTLKKAAGDYTKMKESQGTFLGAMWNKTQTGLGKIASGLYNLSIDYLYLQKELFLPVVGDNYVDYMAKAMKYGEVEGKDVFGFNPTESMRNFFVDNFGTATTSKEYTEKIEREGNIFQRGLLGLAESSPAMIGNSYMRLLNMYALTTDYISKEMEDDPDFKNMSEMEKLMIKAPIGVVGAALEEMGFRNLIRGTSIIKNLTGRVISRLPAGATAAQVRYAAINEIKDLGIKGTLALTGSALAEAETGLLQQVNEYAVKDIYNAMKGKDMFDTPDFLSKKYFLDLADASATEAVGGLVLGVPNAISTAFQKDGFQALDDATFKIFEDLAKDNDSRKFFVTSLKNKINLGEVTPNQGKQMLDAYDQALGMIGMVPDEITDPESRKIAMDLLSERKRLETKKQGKDDALAKPIQNKIDQINEQLTKLTEDAIQKQAQAAQEQPAIPAEISNLRDDETVTFTVKSLDEIPEEFRERASKKEGVEVEVRNTILGLPIGPKKTKVIGEAFTYSLTGKEAKDYAIQKQTASQVSVQPETGAGQEVEVGGTEAKPKITPEESKRKENLIAALEATDKDIITIGDELLDRKEAQAELEAITQKEQAAVTEQGGMEQPEGLGTQLETVAKEEQVATEKTTTSIITSAPIEIKGGVVVTDSDGNDVVVNGNEQVVAKLYDEAMAVPEDQRTSNQNDIVEKVQRIISQAAAETTTAEVTPVEQFTEQDRARKAELEEAMRKADKRRKNVTVGETTMPKSEAKAELDALVQKEQAAQQPAAVEVAPTEVAPTETRTPEQEADLLEELLTGKKKEPTVTEVKAEPTSKEAIAKRLRGKKNKGLMSSIDFGISQALYNGALEFMASQVEKGTKLGNAIENTIKWIDEKMQGKSWNKDGFTKYANDELLSEPKENEQKVKSEKSSGTTQVATTTGSYISAANMIKDIDGDVLDYGAGLGLGTDAMSETLGRDVDSYEPNPERWKGRKKATYTSSDQINKKYDAIVSLNVLNVVPKDIRDAIIKDIFDKLNINGRAIISTRGWVGDVNAAKNAVPGPEDKSLIITRKQNGQDVKVFQKGFDGNELVDYIKSLLGDSVDVVKKSGFGKSGVIITKKSELSTRQSVEPKGKKLSDTIRGLEIKGPGGLQSNILGIPIAIWNAAVKTTAAAIDANVAVAEALQRGAAKIKNWIKKNDPFNKLTDEKINNKVLRETFAGAVKIARDNNVSEEGIKTYLKRKGLTDEQIEVVVKKRESKPATTQAEVKEKTTAKKVDVSDIKELEQIVKLQEDAINAGKTSVTEAVKEFIRLFNKSKIITKLTRSDLNKIINLMGKVSDYKSLQTATGKMFDIILKSNPDLIEVSKTKLAEEFKKKVNAGIRQGKKDLNTKRKELTAAIKEMKKKGSISVRQAKALINRVNAVNLDNPVMVDRLLTYAENIFNDADYDTRIQEVRKLQEKVKKVNHVSMRDTVREFASINPERIPADRLLEYIQALDDMSTMTPFYQKMNDMFDEVMSYKSESKEFDAIKTFQALIDKLESIAINQVKSVEDYVALIRDINSFKRKAYQLLQNGAITQEQYDKAIENVGKDQVAVEKKYEKELAALKEKLVQEINGLKPEVHPDFTPEEAALINKYLELSDDDLASLSPEDLYILNDLLNNIKEDVQLDYYRLSEIVSKAYTNAGGQKLAKQLNESKFNKSSDEGKKLLLEQESAFWEGLLGLGRAVSGALQKFIVSPFNRAIASYENAMKDGYYEFSKLKRKYKMKDYNMHRLGIFTTYLQEYMAQFDPANKDVKDIGTRDWFGEIISNSSMRDGYRSAKPSAKRLVGLGDTELKIIEKIYKSLPKDANGKVDPKAVYDSFMANDGKFFTKKEKAFFDKVMDWKQKNLTTKQKAANEMNGMPFKEIPFHMMRVRLDRGAKQISPTAEGGSGVVRIEAGTGKERASQKVGPIMTNFEQLFTENLEQTARNYYLQEAINDINNTLSVAKKNLKENKEGLFNTIPKTISDALNFEFDKTESQFLARNLLAARAAETLLSPIRTAVELTSTFLSYPFRAKTPQGYKELFGKQGQMKKLLEFTSSPLRLRENINKAIDISDGRIKPKGRFEKALNYLSGLPERTMMVTSWMPTFNNEFKDITGVRFDMDKFKSDAEYRQKYGKAIKEAAAVADAQTEKIIGSTTKAGGRREIRIAPKILANIFGAEGTIKKNTTAGQILGFFSNYPYREVTEFLNGFREAAEVYKQGGGVIKSISQLQKPLGVTINLATYGFLSSVVYAMKLMLLGDDEDEEKGEAALKELVTLKGFMEELQGNAISLAASKYAAGGKAMLQLGATVAYNSTSDEEWKAKIKKLLKNSVFVEPIAAEKVQAYGGRNEVLGAISSYVPQFVLFAKRVEETIQTAGELKVIYNKFQEGGLSALSEDEGLAILAIDGLLKSTQALFNFRYGTSLPMYNDIKMYMKGIKKEAGVGDIKLSGTENQHKKALQGYKNEKEFKENDPDGYLEAIDEGGSIYEYKKKQEEKALEKNKDKLFWGLPSEEAFKKKYPEAWLEKYGPGTDYYEEQRTDEAIERRAEQRRVKREEKRIKAKNKENEEDTEE